MTKKLSAFNQKLKKAIEYKSSKQPYITVNKLAEYMNASPTRRKQIVKILKEDRDFFKVRYRDIRSVIPNFFNSNYDIKILEKSIAKIERKIKVTSMSKWDKDDAKNSILAIKLLMDTDLPDLTDYEIIEAEKLDHITLSDVKVTIKPELYLRNIHSNKIGGVKIHISKTENNRLNLSSMQYAATIIKYGFIDQGFKQNEVDNNACVSIDIFEKNYAASPVAYKRNIDSLSAACEEIALRWDSI